MNPCARLGKKAGVVREEAERDTRRTTPSTYPTGSGSTNAVMSPVGPGGRAFMLLLDGA